MADLMTYISRYHANTGTYHARTHLAKARSLDAAPLGTKLTILSGYTFTVEEA
jgi:hypothetical protein